MSRGRRVELPARLAAGSGVIALVLLLAAPPLAHVAPTAAASDRACTGWTNEYVPPASIRVLRTLGRAAGTVQVVPFERYVASVLAAEFGPTTPDEALKAGAVAVKDFGWYYAMAWRGGSAGGHCYDVTDTTRDQLYWPERIRPVDRQLEAVRDTWRVSVRKNGSFLATGYRNGTPGACGSNADGWRLYQLTSYDCAQRGMLFAAILRTYYGPGADVVLPGIPDPTGDGFGEVGIAVAGPPGQAMPDAAAGRPFYTVVPADTTATAPASGGVLAAAPTDPATTLGWQFADVNGDGRADVLRLVRDGAAGYRIDVSLSEGGGRFAPAETWWSSADGPELSPDATVQLVAGDFDGDGVDEAAIFSGLPGTPPTVTPDGTIVPAVLPEARLVVFHSTGTRFQPGIVAWSGPLDASRSHALAADVTGDGRADLVVTTPLYPQDLTPSAGPTTPAPPAVGADGAELPVGTRFLVAPSQLDGRLGQIGPWLDLPGATPDQARTVVADVDGDGVADLVVFRPSGASGSDLVGLISSGTSFGARVMWSSPSFAWSAAKIAAADVNGDGLADVVALYDAGAAGTRLYQFLSTGLSFRVGARMLDPSIPWADATPF